MSKPVIHIEPRLLDRARMAAALCLSEDTLDLLRKQGCPSIQVPGTKKLLFDPDEVTAWLKDASVNAGAESLSHAVAHKKAVAIFGEA